MHTGTVRESAMPTRRSRDGGRYVHIQTWTCIHSTVHNGTVPTRRRRARMAVGMYMCRRAHAYTALCHESTMPTRRSRDGGRYVHVQACTCIPSTVYESAMHTRRGRGGHHDVRVQTCTCIHSTVRESTISRGEAEMAVGMYTCRRARAYTALCHESIMPTRRSRDGGTYVHVQRRAHAYIALCTRVLCLRGEAEAAIMMYMCRRAHAYTALCTRVLCLRGEGEMAVGMYNMCRRAPTQHRAQGHYAYEAKASGGGGRYDCTYADVHVHTQHCATRALCL
jgi:hypothetical protein